MVSWQVRTSSVWFTCRWLPNTEPCRSNGRVPSISRLETRYFVQPSSVDDRTDDCAFGAMMSLALRPEVQKTAFSDDCRHAAVELEVERLLEQFIERCFEKNMEKLVRELKLRGGIR